MPTFPILQKGRKIHRHSYKGARLLIDPGHHWKFGTSAAYVASALGNVSLSLSNIPILRSIFQGRRPAEISQQTPEDAVGCHKGECRSKPRTQGHSHANYPREGFSTTHSSLCITAVTCHGVNFGTQSFAYCSNNCVVIAQTRSASGGDVSEICVCEYNQ